MRFCFAYQPLLFDLLIIDEIHNVIGLGNNSDNKDKRKLANLISTISTSRIDDAVTRILKVKLRNGLFDNPLVQNDALELIGSETHRTIARQAVRESLVVLKNQDIIPISKEVNKIIVAGRGVDNHFYILEDKFFDKKRSVLDSRIIGLALIANKENPETGDMEPEVLFWVWYPEVRQLLANNFLIVDNQKYVGTKHMTYDEFLTKRLYTSTIIKETNMFDRAIYEYKKTAMQQLLEADRIKNDIRYLESDLWEY